MDRTLIAALHEKYEIMLAMRVADLAVDGQRPEAVWVRRQMRELARRFPGSLREIDQLPLEEIARRKEALQQVLAETRPPHRWMHVMAEFHALARGALVAKRWLRGRKQVDDGLRERFVCEVGELPFPEDGRAWAGHLAAVAAPPRGRLLTLVVDRVSNESGVAVDDVRRWLFGAQSLAG